MDKDERAGVADDRYSCAALGHLSCSGHLRMLESQADPTEGTGGCRVAWLGVAWRCARIPASPVPPPQLLRHPRPSAVLPPPRHPLATWETH